jgi:hypothetical protein
MGRYEPQTPVTAEQKLDAFSGELESARELLAQARDAEMEAKELRDAAYRAAILSDECPKVGVFGGVRTTVAYQQAWIANQIKDQEALLARATLARREAADKHRTLAAQASHQQTLTKSVGDAYRGTGRQPW